MAQCPVFSPLVDLNTIHGLRPTFLRVEGVTHASRRTMQRRCAPGDAVSLLPFPSSSLALAGKPTLQNHCGRGTVDVFAPDPLAALTARASSFQRFVRLQRRPALIDHVDRQAKSFFELGSEAPCGRCKCTRRAIRIIRCSHHEESGMHRSQIALDRAPVGTALQDGYGRKRPSRGGERVTRGESYPFESKIEGEDGVD